MAHVFDRHVASVVLRRPSVFDRAVVLQFRENGFEAVPLCDVRLGGGQTLDFTLSPLYADTSIPAEPLRQISSARSCSWFPELSELITVNLKRNLDHKPQTLHQFPEALKTNPAP
jgi:hypothetical protein